MIIVSLIGLKKCGKTSTAEALIKEFKKRGYVVGGMKFMPYSSFTIDTKGKDTWRQREAGADFVISISKDELAYIEKKDYNRRERGETGGERGVKGRWGTGSSYALDDALRVVPEGTDILICEGLTQDDPRILRVLVARSLELLGETFEVRGIQNPGGQAENRAEVQRGGWSIEDGTKVAGDKARIIALSGIMANEGKEHPDYPVFNCMTKEGAEGLADLILRESESSP